MASGVLDQEVGVESGGEIIEQRRRQSMGGGKYDGNADGVNCWWGHCRGCSVWTVSPAVWWCARVEANVGSTIGPKRATLLWASGEVRRRALSFYPPETKYRILGKNLLRIHPIAGVGLYIQAVQRHLPLLLFSVLTDGKEHVVRGSDRIQTSRLCWAKDSMIQGPESIPQNRGTRASTREAKSHV